MKTIGLTGAMGCGKSAAAAAFRELGALALEADAIAHQVLDEDPEVRSAVKSLFGESSYHPNGKANREAIARTAFAAGSDEKLKRLEDILHPAIRHAWKKIPESNAKVLIVEVPLLFEKKLENDFDLCVSVLCSEGLRMSRLAQRGMTPAQIAARDALQIPSLKKAELCDVVLFNEGDKSFLKKQAELVLSRL